MGLSLTDATLAPTARTPSDRTLAQANELPRRCIFVVPMLPNPHDLGRIARDRPDLLLIPPAALDHPQRVGRPIELHYDLQFDELTPSQWRGFKDMRDRWNESVAQERDSIRMRHAKWKRWKVPEVVK